MIKDSKLWLLIALAFAGITAQAHPHVNIEQQLGLVFDDKGLAGILVKWRFDYFYSEAAAESYDLNRDDKLSPEEIAALKQDLFTPIEAESNYLFIRLDGVRQPSAKATDFSAELKNGALWMTFFVPCQVALTDTPQELIVETYDPSYYNEVVFSKTDPVFARDANRAAIKTSLRQSADTAYYFDQVHPWALVAELRQKP